MTVTVCLVKCWPCIHGHHEGGQHDVPDLCSNTAPPVLCGCPCTTDPTIPTVPLEMEPPDLDDASLTDSPCPLCGEVGACEYDMYGRPLIHAITGEYDMYGRPLIHAITEDDDT